MNVGDRVCVKESVVVYHYPKSRNQAFDLKGMEGEVAEVIGGKITANYPVKVKFEGKFVAHLNDQELELV